MKNVLPRSLFWFAFVCVLLATAAPPIALCDQDGAGRVLVRLRSPSLVAHATRPGGEAVGRTSYFVPTGLHARRNRRRAGHRTATPPSGPRTVSPG